MIKSTQESKNVWDTIKRNPKNMKVCEFEFSGGITPTKLNILLSKISPNLLSVSCAGCLVNCGTEPCNVIKSKTKIQSHKFDISAPIIIENNSIPEVGRLEITSDGSISIYRDGKFNFSSGRNGFAGFVQLINTK